MSGAVASQTVDTGGTVRMRACMPGTLSMPLAIASASSRGAVTAVIEDEDVFHGREPVRPRVPGAVGLAGSSGYRG
jgi:hypothetical protein